MTYRLLLLLIAAVLGPGSAAAQIQESEYADRRARLADRMGEGTLVAFGAPNYLNHRFDVRQLPAFAYLTGFAEPDAVLVLVHDKNGLRGDLFTLTPTVRTQLYDGFREAPDALAARTGLRVRPLGEMAAYVDSLAASGQPLFELRDHQADDYASRDTLTRGGMFVRDLAARHGRPVTDLHEVVNDLRARKSAAEVALLQRAVDITEDALGAAFAMIEPGVWEYEVEATIEHAFRSAGAEGPSFASIVGAGPNSTTLHYVENDRRAEAGELLLMDVGASYAGYAADITRTVPVSGRFSAEQRAIYDIVLQAQKAAEALVRPGAPAAASLAASQRIRLEGLAGLGLIEHPDATFDPPWPVDCEARPAQCLQGNLFMIHGISHGIGLEVHDPASFATEAGTYQPGDVFTIEPGLYVSLRALDLLDDTSKNRAFREAVRATVARYDNIGVRIEDDYLVTENGVQRMSTGVPREPGAIERAMSR